jgi:acetyl esterase/lipase
MNISKIMPLRSQQGEVDYAAEEGNIPNWQVFAPEPGQATGAAMVILPGGGYEGLADHEGAGFAKWLVEHGITCLVVKYRLGGKGHRHPAMWHDAARAVRLARFHAKEWGIDPRRVGVMGSSAGGHLAATILTQFDAGDANHGDLVERESSRPDLGVLCYPVISMGPYTHSGSKENLLGTKAPQGLVDSLSNEKRVTVDTPPCFIWHTWEDATVPVENSMMFARSLREKGVRFELHIYEYGGHGMGLGDSHRWALDCLAWLKECGFAC